MSPPKVLKSVSESAAHFASNESESSSELSENEFEVEKLVGKRIIKGVLKYKVRWVGYDATDDTWENVDNMNCSAKIEEYERELEQKKATKRTRAASRSSEYKLSNAAKRLRPTTPSRTVKAGDVRAPSSSKKIPKETASSKTAPSKASTSKSNKTVNNDASTMDKRSTKSKTGAKATNKSPTDRTKIVSPLPPSRTPTLIVPSPTTVADEATTTTSVPIASISAIISPQSINPATAANEEETLNVRNKSINMEKITAAAPVTKNKLNEKGNDDLNNRLCNMVTTNNNEASTGIVEGRPLNVAQSADDTMDQPVAPIIPADHQCFGNSPTISEFAKHAVIHHVDNLKMEKVFSKTWKMRCTDCTEKYTVNDNTVEFGYCILTVGDSVPQFMIKLNKCNSELFLINSDKFKSTCPKSYRFFVCITRIFFDTLGDLDLAIEEQKDVVQKYFNNSVLKPYKENGTLQTCQSKAVREIGRLFFLELQLAIGRYMRTVVDFSELYKFIMDFYENREKKYAVVRKEAVENIYKTFCMS